MGDSFKGRRIANLLFQTISLLCLALACGNAVVLSGYNGHGLAYTDYGDLDAILGATEYKVLPTVSVPVHAVSAAPVHVDATLHHGHTLHTYKHHTSKDHDYYVSSGTPLALTSPFSLSLRAPCTFFFLFLAVASK